MEIFVDFGLFELLVVSGLGVWAVRAYRHRMVAAACLLTSVVAPAVLVWLADGTLVRWTAAVALGTALINVSVIVRSLEPRHRWSSEEES